MHESDKATINPYLTFNGNTREVMEFYKKCLDGELDILNFDEAPMEIADEDKNTIKAETKISTIIKINNFKRFLKIIFYSF